ncbi:hypothetical protein IFM89_017846 [Coptis chinensis]|uniref:Uncharacterized protein n=1 Tax=Coptis chinensis TaxID=261450 RepID=A0A835LYG8_9MAGN|nr:hypothetical protein IFM89_017846 [Coptis chinensis]
MGHQEMKLVKGVGKNNKKRGSSSVIDLSRDLKKQALEWEGQFGKVLEKIMKHKHAWVFNSPVDVVGMGLHDYNAIIKQPMDLGTAKLNLERGLYSTPVEFAQDVRLTFNNALTYNPPGHDVFIMAKDLLARFERSFSPAFKKFQQQTQRNNHNVAQQQQQQMKWGGGDQHSDRFEERRAAAAYHRTPTVEAAVARKPMPVPTPREEVVVPEMEVTRPPVVLERSGGNGKLAKPKAKDLNKRMMTFEEKQKMSLCLEELPQEKMDQVVQIMRRRNAALSQKDDEIEVDIEVLDIETLWELDRFVCNYNKMVSKIKKIEALDGGQKPLVSADGNKSPVSEMTEAVASEKSKKIEPVCVEEDIDIGEDMPTHNFPPVEIEKESSSSGGSSGSDSDSSSGSDTSSDSDSDADDAQSPCVESKSSPKS